MTTSTLLFGGLIALAVAFFWVALDLAQRNRLSAARIEQTVASQTAAFAPELEAPFAERVLQPLFRRILRRIGALSPGRNIERLRQDLLIAGSPYGLTPLDFVGVRLLLATVGTLLAAALLLSSHAPALQRLLLLPLCAIGCFELPLLWLRQQMKRRQRQIQLALADALDMITICIDAGLGMEAAFMKVGQTWDHALAREFKRVVQEMGVGMSWREAMRNLAYRTDVPDLSSLVAVLLQADQLGFSIGDTLHAQAGQLRVRRRQRAQEMARSAPFKMLFPMVLFIMPATLAVILGPALPALMEVLSQAVK